jgi:mycothiol synthase
VNFAICTRSALSTAEANAVRALADHTAKRDGAPPLSEDALLRLDDSARGHLLLQLADSFDSPEIRGYAQLTDGQDGVVTEIVGDAESVMRLLGEVEKSGRAVTIWSHGKQSPVAPIARERGYQTVRVLWQLRRDLSKPALPDATPLPIGVTIRPFAGNSDEQALLAVNSAAFASHPEQGQWSLEDLHVRMAQPWFDPNGLLVAVTPTNEILGFHWTKSHADQIGEVYVLAVSPKAQGLRLGAALLLAGLKYLAAQGAPLVSLYVDDDNTAAIALYERYGFVRYEYDTQLRRTVSK